MSQTQGTSELTAGAEATGDSVLAEYWPIALLLLAGGAAAAMIAAVLVDAYEVRLGTLAEWAAVLLAGAALAVVARRGALR